MNQKYSLNAIPTFNSVTIAAEEKKIIKRWNLAPKYFGSTTFEELLSFKENGKFKKFPHYKQFYDAKSKGLVHSLYSEDVLIFQKAITKIK